MTAASPNTLDDILSLLPPELANLKNFNLESLGEKFAEKPCQNTLLLLGLATLLFYQAERDHNPKVNDIFDSLIYCSTSLSVGYGDIFAKTPLGKLIGSALMTFGPSMSGAMLDAPQSKAAPDTNAKILATLEQILAELRATK